MGSMIVEMLLLQMKIKKYAAVGIIHSTVINVHKPGNWQRVVKENAVKRREDSSVTIMSVYKKVRNVMELINVVINLMRSLCLVALVHFISMILRDAVNNLENSSVIMENV